MAMMLRKLYYNLWYYFKPPWDTGISPPELLTFIKQHSPGCALDLGCGTGTNVITLAKNNWDVVGVDFSQRAIMKARKKALQAGVSVKLFVDDVTRLRTLSGYFDLILDIGCYHSIAHELRPRYLLNLKRFLANKGTYMLYGFIKSNEFSEGSGITEQEIAEISQLFILGNRKDGSERGIRPSTWLIFYNTQEQ